MCYLTHCTNGGTEARRGYVTYSSSLPRMGKKDSGLSEFLALTLRCLLYLAFSTESGVAWPHH